jgi:hypothetical protein
MQRKYEVVYSANGMLDAEMIRLFLEANGIEAFISQESAGITYGLTVGPLGQAKVYALAEQADEAIRILKEMDRGEFSLPEGNEGDYDDSEEAPDN